MSDCNMNCGPKCSSGPNTALGSPNRRFLPRGRSASARLPDPEKGWKSVFCSGLYSLLSVALSDSFRLRGSHRGNYPTCIGH